MTTDKPGAGHNSGDDEQQTTRIGGIAAEALRSFIERIERLHEEKKALEGDLKDVYAQCKSQGFDTKIIKRLIALRRIDPQAREEGAQLLALYAAAIGEQLPLNL
ncbi:hypothetical protein H261_03353 [Paramagnetospirillum caucaseum]|uniref:GapR-like DNA-binding domain-containing protein n=1 Tax=Paramagnetospirillum caucaseum TaxID=1244869 RepID=M3AEX6_9PROT|nr:DUF2312 domain-containing protein [Paramagnetospirillum caucaseum]EME71413.1 hypothetical protein H261_03353 [Paramagnetospirillum caucaseum]